jgi:hypothetical protein
LGFTIEIYDAEGGVSLKVDLVLVTSLPPPPPPLLSSLRAAAGFGRSRPFGLSFERLCSPGKKRRKYKRKKAYSLNEREGKSKIVKITKL